MDNWALFAQLPSTCMICLLTWPVFSVMYIMVVVSHTGSLGLLIFVVYFGKGKVLLGPKFLKCMCIHVGLFEKKNWFVIDRKNSDRLHGFSHKWEMSIWPITSWSWNFWPVKTITWVFLPLWCGSLPKWMKVNVSNVCWLPTTIESWL